jgi:hypothetical protein
MEQEVQTTGNTALQSLTPEQQEALQNARSLNKRPSAPSIPQIKVASPSSEIEGVAPGNFYTEVYDPETEKNILTDIGVNPAVVILHRAYMYSYYDKDSNKLLAWTSDIQGFSKFDKVYLYSIDGEKAGVEWDGGYQDFKKYIKENYTMENKRTGKVENLLKFRNVLYVLHGGMVFRMFASNASVTGIAKDSTMPDYKKPQINSLIHFCDLAGVESGDTALFESVCELGTELRKNGEVRFYLITFRFAGPNPKLANAVDCWNALLASLKLMQEQDVKRMSQPAREMTKQSEALPDFEELPTSL